MFFSHVAEGRTRWGSAKHQSPAAKQMTEERWIACAAAFRACLAVCRGAPGATEVQGESGEKTKGYKKKRPRSSPWTGRLRCRLFYCTCPGGKRQAESNIFHIFRSGPAGRALDRICFFMHDYTNDTPRPPFRARRSRGVARRHILKEVFPHANPPRHPG